MEEKIKIILTKKSKIIKEKEQLNKINEEEKKYSGIKKLIHSALNISKIKFCVVTENLSEYVNDLTKMDEILIKYQVEGAFNLGINYDNIINKRNKYKTILENLFNDLQKLATLEEDLIEQIERKQNTHKKDQHNISNYKMKNDGNNKLLDSLEFNI